MSIAQMNETAGAVRRAYFGADVQVTDSFDRDLKDPDGRPHPFQIARWKVAGQRHAVLLEPVLKSERERLPLHLRLFMNERTRYVMDQQAMREQLRNLVQSTLAGVNNGD